MPRRRVFRILIGVWVLLAAQLADADRVWWNGERDSAEGAPGKLLSDNPGYWGDAVLTGVEYSYRTEPTNPRDQWRDDAARFGKRLLDGVPSGDWYTPVGVNAGPLVVDFDFKRPCTFSEVDVCTRGGTMAFAVACSDTPEGPWRDAAISPVGDGRDTNLHRLLLRESASGRYLRLSAEAEGITYVTEVVVWGDAAEHSGDTDELQIAPDKPAETALVSISGIEDTTVSDAAFWKWQRDIGSAAEYLAVWAEVPAWDAITDGPLLPEYDRINRPVTLRMARNETECAAVALINTSWSEARSEEISLTPFRAATEVSGEVPSGSVRAMGAIRSRDYGVNLGPLFETDNMPGGSLLRKHITNAASIARFPEIVLSPGGACVFWLSVSTQATPPGIYEADLQAGDGLALRIRVEVVDVLLPEVDVWLNTWSGITGMFPFEYAERTEREVAYKSGLGVSVWHSFPAAGTISEHARQAGPALFYTYGLPREWVDKGYGGAADPEDITPEDKQAIAAHVRGLVEQAQASRLDYEDWFVELWDEPGPGNGPLYGALAACVKEADPNVRIYCNPCFWTGGEQKTHPDETVYEALAPWYQELIDVSVPLYLLLEEHPKSYGLFDASRPYRAFYNVCTQSAKSQRREQVELYRRQAWQAFSRGWNGWGFYSYYAPRGNPWDDFDGSWHEDRPDYLMVYPGPRGPIPTRQSEAVREGWEDYRLLSFLRENGHTEELGRILQRYADGAPLDVLRESLLAAAVKPVPDDEPLDFEVQLDVPHREFDGSFCWFHARAGAVPNAGYGGQPAVVMTMQKWFLSASDFFSVLSDMRTDDLGAVWVGPTEREVLGWRETGPNSVVGVCDFTPGWHAPSGRLLAFGHTVRYVNDHLAPEPRKRSVSYSIYDVPGGTWAPWQTVALPDGDTFFSAGAGCSQWLTEPDGTMLVPVYFKGKSEDSRQCATSTVMRFAFDGETVAYLGHGNEMTVPEPRGLGETSITWFDGRYYLTLRNDVKGYVAVSDDGLRFSEPIPWTFDDGQEIGNYNTQQHWATHSDGLYLVYTRRGANNDHIVRNRAPLFIGRVDPEKLCIVRDSERVVIPKRGAMLGNFGVATISEYETWVTVGEGMHNAEKITEGADGSVFVGRIRWTKPNRLAFPPNGRRIP